MENNIQSSLIGQNVLNSIRQKNPEEKKDETTDKFSTLEIVDNVSINVSVNNKAIIDANNSKGFLELSKISIRNIDDGIAKLHNLSAAFSSLETTHEDRANILNRTSEITQEVEERIKNSNFNNKHIALASSHNIGSKQIDIGSNEKKENTQLENLNQIDKAIHTLNRSKEKIQEKIDVLNDFIQKEEVFVVPNDKVTMTQKELDIIQENIRDRNDLLSVAHKATNEKIASLFF